MRINIWTNTKDKGYTLKIVRRSESKSEVVMNFLQHEQHVMLILDLDKISKVFACPGCDDLFYKEWGVIRHLKICCGQVQQDEFPEKYQGGVFKTTKNVIIQCAELLGVVNDCDFSYDYVATYDYEAMLKQNIVDLDDDELLPSWHQFGYIFEGA